MTLCLPLLGAKQTLYSWCAQLDAWNNLGSARATSFFLFHAPATALCHDFPGNLDTLVARYPEVFLDAEEIALRHTLLGYFLALHPRDRALDLLSCVRTGTLPSLKMRLGITASRVGGNHPLKGCDECIASELDRTGFASWNVEHQLPSAMMCLTHGRPLFLAHDPVSPVHRRAWLLPTSSNWMRRDLISLSKNQQEELLRLSEYSSKLAAQPVGRFDPQRLAVSYQAGLRSKGLCTPGGSLRLKPLLRFAAERYAGLAVLPGFESLNSLTETWPGLLGTVSRSSARGAHPLKHLLVIALAYETWSEFENAYDHPELPPPASASPSNNEAFARNLRTLVEEEHVAITVAARMLGQSPTKALVTARRESIAFSTRPKKLRGPLLTSLRAQLRAGKSVAAASESSGVSNVTVSRLLAGDPELHRAWTDIRFEHCLSEARVAFRNEIRSCRGGKSVKTIRSKPGSKYWWLYAHDRSWLARETSSLGAKSKGGLK